MRVSVDTACPREHVFAGDAATSFWPRRHGDHSVDPDAGRRKRDQTERGDEPGLNPRPRTRVCAPTHRDGKPKSS
jgi:hypothetical protein